MRYKLTNDWGAACDLARDWRAQGFLTIWRRDDGTISRPTKIGFTDSPHYCRQGDVNAVKIDLADKRTSGVAIVTAIRRGQLIPELAGSVIDEVLDEDLAGEVIRVNERVAVDIGGRQMLGTVSRAEYGKYKVALDNGARRSFSPSSVHRVRPVQPLAELLAASIALRRPSTTPAYYDEIPHADRFGCKECGDPSSFCDCAIIGRRAA